jgi:hypothetical protein
MMPINSDAARPSQEPDRVDRQISELLLRLIRAKVPYATIHRVLWEKQNRTREELLVRLSSLLPCLNALVTQSLSSWVV